MRGVINLPAANYVKRTLRDAEERRTSLVVIEMDTPDGSDHSMREIIQDILSSPVPVAVYFAPSGAWAASAGLLSYRCRSTYKRGHSYRRAKRLALFRGYQ
jgi:membrane-bound serine protease (ClpP class)